MKKRIKLFLSSQYGWLSVISSILLVILMVMSQILQNASQFAESYSTLLFIAFFGIILLVIILVKTLLKLRQQYRQKVAGIKLTTRLTLIISALLGIPLTIVFYFSMSFVHQGIDQWFDVKTETALSNAVKLVQTSLDDQTRRKLNSTQQALKRYQQDLINSPILTLNKIGEQLNARELSLYNSDGQLIAYNSQENIGILPTAPAPRLFQQIRKRLSYAAIETQPGANSQHQFIHVILPVNDLLNNKLYALQVIFPIPDQLSNLANTVQVASGQYQELSYLRAPLKTSFTVILTMVLLLTLISALLFTIRTIENITRPIRTLAEGTEEVSKGNYSLTMPIDRQDEMGQLIQSFNDMIQQIAKARNEIKFGQQQAEMQKLYLQAIIKNLNSGVLTFDNHMRLKTLNDATNLILNTDLFSQVGNEIGDILNQPDYQALNGFFEQVFPLFREDAKPWSQQLSYDDFHGRKMLLVHGSTLPSLDQKFNGYVIVIEDITKLIKAQLHAAWSDVAQRLAHEIKNPLTPIQLSAERLNFKLSSKLEDSDQKLLARMTDTIIEQVLAMQNLVDAFTEYADTPELELTQLDLNGLVKDVVNMYKDPKANWRVSYEIDPQCPTLSADPAKLRQLLHNLIKNGLEACETIPQGRVRVMTQSLDEHHIQLRVCDNGNGIPETIKNWIFEPYATGKPKGTGLGLSIVKKIVDEHHGQIQVESSPDTGTCFIIKLPQTQ
ncbi:histidine kinase [Hydrogenovibrio sp. SC-1]|uniref:ATP-binding protein n=1 Tax=Hydrogenovibrio sp. SC-1 TaxID=2065820 RepID=UPI000C7A10F6|nr:ATP-binding protein [Hydrogenovibrio sp. SC-1]PLA75227.1 histidine kinase [Hydrogenovibrio sp. SC-1]